MNTKPKIAILHDAFLYRGGGERLVTLMAKVLNADLIAGFFSDGSFDPRELGFEGQMIALGRPVFAKGIRHEILRHRFLTRTRFLSQYDTVIFSGNCLDAVKNVGENTRKIYYCHTPPRYIFDLRSQYLQKIPKFLHPLAHFFLDKKAKRYIDLLSQMDVIVTNSENVEKRLRDFTGYDSEIIYPPTDIRRFAPNSKQRAESREQSGTKNNNSTLPTANCQLPTPYYLSFARLSPPKRVDIIVSAFESMPDQHLVFCYGRNDPMRDQILSQIEGKPNFTALESPDDTTLIHLIQNATATVYIPVDEDFGMSPVESMACGTPVIGAAEGGLLETIVEGKTGKLIQIQDAKSGIQNLRQVIQNTKKEEWESMHEACIEQAGRFSLEKFQKQLESIIIK